MDQYESALLYDSRGNFRGNVILKNIQGGIVKLHSLNIWTDDEQSALADQLARLNSETAIMSHWPRMDDPEVQALLANSQWEPVALETSEEVDQDQSYIVQKEDGSGIDYEASVIITKPVQVPSRTGVAARVRLAMETVARSRAAAISRDKV